ncbi:MAG TPA: polyphosphate kinase 2 family protein [Rhizomicrobium sp.]|nr:polyphosphate kinase 2 family protein [Rhizomicrobium sp.]
MKLEDIPARFRIDQRKHFRLTKHDPAECCGLSIEKAEAKTLLAQGLERLADLQQRLYAQDQWAVLVVLQGMDASGKDSLIKHVMSGVNPQGVEVTPFKEPSRDELQHNFLWRVTARLPARGRIGMFNRSHYEEVLISRVHPEVLARQNLPKVLVGKKFWQNRLDDIRTFELHLARNGTLILKFFLNISREEQRKRFLARIDQPDKRWKFSMSDVAERRLWPKYMAAYEKVIRETSRDYAPWYVVPADNKWFTRMVVSAALVDALERLKPDYPKIARTKLKELEAARRALLGKRGR